MGIWAFVSNQAICARARHCTPIRKAMLAVFFVLLGLLALRPFCVPIVPTGYGGSSASADRMSWVVSGADRSTLREKGPCSLGFKLGDVLTTAHVTGSVIAQIGDLVPLAPAPDLARPLSRSRAAAKRGVLADPPQLAFYARSARILR